VSHPPELKTTASLVAAFAGRPARVSPSGLLIEVSGNGPPEGAAEALGRLLDAGALTREASAYPELIEKLVGQHAGKLLPAQFLMSNVFCVDNTHGDTLLYIASQVIAAERLQQAFAAEAARERARAVLRARNFNI
jgi:hypothetical protein